MKYLIYALFIFIVSCDSNTNSTTPSTGFRVTEVSFIETNPTSDDQLLEEKIIYSYDSVGRVSALEYVEFDGVSNERNEAYFFSYNQFHQIMRSEQVEGDNKEYTEYQYNSSDENAMVVSATAYSMPSDATAYVKISNTIFSYDSDNRLTQKQTVRYSSADRTVVDMTTTIVINYSTNGEILNKETAQHYAGASNAETPTVDTFAYNSQSQLVSVNSVGPDGHLAHLFTYGNSGEIVEHTITSDDYDHILRMQFKYQSATECNEVAFHSIYPLDSIINGQHLCQQHVDSN